MGTALDIFQIFKETAGKLKNWAISKELVSAAEEYKQQLEKLHGTIRILGMQQPIELKDIFTKINILEKITSRIPASVEELHQYFEQQENKFINKQKSEEGFQAIEKYRKIIVLGKPGAGKTTFLRYIAIRAANGGLSDACLPIFISLKDWSDTAKAPSDICQELMDFIVSQFNICHFNDAKPFIKKMLEDGKCIVLFDGLDEVSKKKEEQIVKEIKYITDTYSKNKFIISCRIAAFNYVFEKFTNVEMADFDDEQIKIFVEKWFKTQSQKSQACLKEIKANSSIEELATIPLLLTLLCLVFDETMSFPKNRAELYEEAIDALLKKWDASRSIKRESAYKEIPLKRKEYMLSQIAYTAFEKGQYFLPQRTLEHYISDFIRNIPGIKEEELQIDSEDILKDIEAQHGIFVERARGIYSFSHLTFQEYFTAKYIVDNKEKGTLENLVDKYITDKKWREVFLLTTGLLPEADTFLLLMKEKADSLVNVKLAEFFNIIYSNSKLHNYLIHKFSGNDVKENFLRAAKAYTTIDINLMFSQTFSIAGTIVRDRDNALFSASSLAYAYAYALDSALARALGDALDQALNCEFGRAINCVHALNFAQELDIANALDRDLDLKLVSNFNLAMIQVQEIDRDRAHNNVFGRKFDYVYTHASNCAHALSSGLDLDLAYILNEYFQVLDLLLNCLSAECYVTKTTRQKILDELLMIPEKYRKQLPEGQTS